MAVTCGFFNSVNGDRVYNADTMSTFFRGLVSDGVYANVGDGMQVVAGGGMNVSVKAGRCLIDCKWCENDSALTLPITAASPSLNRYTAVVARLDYSNRLIEITTKDGTAASSPTKPTIQKDSQYKELCLAMIYVAKGATAISQSAIADTRASADCGWVTGLIQQVDTSALFLQWQTAYEEFYAAFQSWFDTLTSQLQVNTYITSFEKRVTGSAAEVAEIPLDMSGYEYAESDIIEVFINGLAAVKDVDWTIDNSIISVNLSESVSADNEVYVRVLKSKIGDPAGGGGSTFKALNISERVQSSSTITTTVEST